ncbi:MAG: DGQHR domain-containing protein [Methylobacter sp.]|nr:DGQHR domain-containing protein [Methylobacter sp.]
MKNLEPFVKVPSIIVEQPFGSFYLASIRASKLVKITYSLPAKYGDNTLNGVQRGLNRKRVENIAKFCKTESPLFPNSVILAANILEDGSLVEDDIAWMVTNDGYLLVPQMIESASIVDGQHRIEGMKLALESGMDDFDIVCSIYMDLPAPKQAEVFATINFNQQKVDKSLAYQLFGYNLDSTEPEYWAPDTLAISLTRILNKNIDSPFKNHIAYGMKDKHLVFENMKEEQEYFNDPWKVSTATMVDGITKLISSNPTEDRYELHKKRAFKKDRSILKEINRRSSEPWREYYLNYKDGQLFDNIENYFLAVNSVLWCDGGLPLLRKTIGIQALFDLLKIIAENESADEPYTKEFYLDILGRVNLKNIADLETNYSGLGRTRIKNVLIDSCYPVT